MRKIITSLLICLGLILAGGAHAQAAADITHPGSCSVSDNWLINTSVNFNDTHGNPSRGTLDYIVVNSPGALAPFSAHWWHYLGHQSGGTSNFIRDWSKPGYVYRADPSAGQVVAGTRRVQINPVAHTGISCSDYGEPSTIYSAN